MFTFLLLYAGIIPIVPLIGAEILKRRGDRPGRLMCYVLFAAQLMLSIYYVMEYVQR